MDKHVLFFIEGHSPTPDEREAASAFGDNVTFRTARYVSPLEEHLEQVDGIAGAVPGVYASSIGPDGGKRYEILDKPVQPDPTPDVPMETGPVSTNTAGEVVDLGPASPVDPNAPLPIVDEPQMPVEAPVEQTETPPTE